MTHAGDTAMTLPQWAREVMGWKSASAAYKARDDGRLVFADDARKTVWAQASLARYEATADPTYHARTAARRGAETFPRPRDSRGRGQGEGVPPHPNPPPLSVRGAHGGGEGTDGARADGDSDTAGAQGALDFGAYDFQGAKAKREHFAAERERLQYLREAGELVRLADVIAAWAEAGAVLRARLESLPAILPAELAGKDEAQQRAIIHEHIHAALNAATAAVEKLIQTLEQKNEPHPHWTRP